MANHYLQFSEMLVLDNLQQADWIQAQLNPEALERLRGYQQENHADELTIPPWAQGLVLARHILDDRDADFQWEITAAAGKFELALFAHEYGDIDAVVLLVQEYLKRYAPARYFTLSWACTCDKMSACGFGGGAVCVTAISKEFIDTQQWLDQRRCEAGRPLARANAGEGL